MKIFMAMVTVIVVQNKITADEAGCMYNEFNMDP